LELTDDEARLARLAWVNQGLGMDSWRWRVLRVPDDVRQPFVLPDTGFFKFTMPGRPDEQVLFLPLAPRVGLLGSRALSGEPVGFEQMDHRQVTGGALEWLNYYSVQTPGRRMCITHTERKDWLGRVVNRLAADLPKRFPGGPYRGRDEDWL